MASSALSIDPRRESRIQELVKRFSIDEASIQVDIDCRKYRVQFKDVWHGVQLRWDVAEKTAELLIPGAGSFKLDKDWIDSDNQCKEAQDTLIERFGSDIMPGDIDTGSPVFGKLEPQNCLFSVMYILTDACRSVDGCNITQAWNGPPVRAVKAK